MSGTDRYMTLFLSEGRDLVEEMGAALRELADGSHDSRNALFRSAHSLKGMAASVDLQQVSGLAHAIEDAFQCLSNEEWSPDKELADLLWQGVDALAESLDRLQEGGKERSLGAYSQAIRAWVLSNGSDVSEEGHAEGPVEVLSEDLQELQADEGERPANIELSIELSEDIELPAARLAVLRARISALATIVSTAGTPGPGGKIVFQVTSDRPAKDLAAALREEEGVASIEAHPIPGPGVAKADRMVRVPEAIMDMLLEEATEVLVHHAHLERLVPESEIPEMRFSLARLKTTASRLLNGLLEARLQPFHSIVPRLERTVRELERRLGKEADLVVDSNDVYLDRGILESLIEPLTHLIRNAMDHGIESRQERSDLGKPGRGELRVSLRQSSDTIELVLEDDGRGMDSAGLLRRALEAGALDQATADYLDDEESLLLATLPGITTTEQATEVSGRGVGLDAVRDRIESMGGSLLLHSEWGRGTNVTLRLPPTVALLQVFLVRIDGRLYAVPVRKILETVPISPGTLHRTNGRALLPWTGDAAEAFPLDAALEGRLSVPNEKGVALVYKQRGEPRAIIVDEILGSKEVVIKPLVGPLEAMGELTGVAVLGDGTVAPVLDLENVGPPMEALARRTA